jgi:hypothetical protein
MPVISPGAPARRVGTARSARRKLAAAQALQQRRQLRQRGQPLGGAPRLVPRARAQPPAQLAPGQVRAAGQIAQQRQVGFETMQLELPGRFELARHLLDRRIARQPRFEIHRAAQVPQHRAKHLLGQPRRGACEGGQIQRTDDAAQRGGGMGVAEVGGGGGQGARIECRQPGPHVVEPPFAPADGGRQRRQPHRPRQRLQAVVGRIEAVH